MKITYTGDPRGVLGAIKQIDEAHASFGDRLRQTGQKISSAGSTLTKGLTLPIVGFGVAAVKAFTDAQQVTAQTEAVIKSTGGAANVTAQEVGGLATRIMNYSGLSDEAVASGENMLLTFTNIRNEVGKGNAVFNQATKILADMSIALGQDMSSSAIQLGKALNDPIKGLTALQRVGVSFTEAQEKMITKLVEAGDVMGAQKIILGELTKEFGGSAKAAGETAAGAFNIAKEKIGNSMESIGKAIVEVGGPILGKLASGIDNALGAFNKLDAGTKETVVKIAAAVAAFGPLLFIVGKVTTAVGILASSFTSLGSAIIAHPIAAAVVGITIGVVALAKAAHDTEARIQAMTEALLQGQTTIAEEADLIADTTVKFSRLGPKVSEAGLAYGELREAQERANAIIRANISAIVEASGAHKAMTDAIVRTEGATLKERTALAQAIETLAKMSGGLTEAEKKTIKLYLEQNHLSSALDFVLRSLRDVNGALGNMQSQGERAAEAQADLAQRTERANDALREQNRAAHSGGEGLRYYLSYATRAAEAAADLGQRVAYANSQLANTPRGGGTGGSTGGHVGLQHGGIVTRPTFALIGEAGPEAVIPLSRGRGGAGVVTNLYVTIPGTVVGPGGVEEVGDILLRYLQKHGIRNVTAGIP